MTQPITSTVDIPKEIQKIINAKEETSSDLQKYANEKDVILLAFIGSIVPRRYNPSTSATASINIFDEFGIEKVLSEIQDKVTNYKEKKVYFLINSTGGNLSSAYKNARAIRNTFTDITVFVPHYALSGGTLLALTGNRIRMGMMSQLSPLDVQVFYEEQTVSINSLFRAQATLDRMFATKKPEELPYTYQFQAEALDPIIIEEWGGIQQEGRIYLKEVLLKTGYNEDLTDKIIDALMFGFPTHGFVIHYEHAKELGLKAEKFDADIEAWNLMKCWLSNYLTQQTDRHFIRYVIPKNIDKKEE